MNQNLVFGLLGGVSAVVFARRRAGTQPMNISRSSPKRDTSGLKGSIARVTEWAGDEWGYAELLSGKARGTTVIVWATEITPVGERVVLAEESAEGWRVVHLDDADAQLG